jgi:peptidoglycan/xylan/chitin deacetylase (PgdA/CDA1 family)
VSPAGRHARLSTLIFHRVLPVPDPMFPDEPDAERFDTVCRWLAGWFNVLPLDVAVQRLRSHRLPERALAITFDDGYADNHDVALPILTRHGLPATFFVATGFLDGGRMWNDTVIEALRLCRAPELDLRGLAGPELGVLGLADTAARRAAIDRVLRAIKYLPIAARLEAAQQIVERSGVEPSRTLMMRSDQVRALRRAGMQVGAHTVTHPILATLDDSAARAEIGQSKHTLETLLGEPVTLFAYPNGRPGQDYSPRSVEIARELGFEAAVTTAKGVASAATDPFQIPRFTPWDRTRARFGVRMAGNLWAHGSARATVPV